MIMSYESFLNNYKYFNESSSQTTFSRSTSESQLTIRYDFQSDLASSRGYYNQTPKKIQIIEFEIVYYSEELLAEKFRLKLDHDKFIKLSGFYDILTMKEIFDYIKDGNFEILGKESQQYVGLCLYYQFSLNGKDYPNKISLNMKKVDMNSEQKCKSFMKQKETIHQYQLAKMYEKIMELENKI